MKPRLLSSALTLPGIEAAINAFWFSEDYYVNPRTQAIENALREPPKGFRVILKKGRYRFEYVGE